MFVDVDLSSESVNEEMKMVGRESELSLLKTFIEGHVTSKVAGSMYVSGPPGTGKSASIHQLLQQEEVRPSSQLSILDLSWAWHLFVEALEECSRDTS